MWSNLSPIVTLVTCPNMHNTIPYLSLFPGKSLFPEIHFVWEATFTDKIFFQGSNIFQEVALPGESYIPVSHISQKFTFTESHVSKKVTFPGKTHFPGSHISREFIFPGKPHFPWSHISREVTFPGMSNFLGQYIFWEVTFSGKYYFPGSQNFREVTYPGNSHVPGIHMSREVTKQQPFDEGCQNVIIGLWRRRRRRRKKTTCWPAALVADGLAAGKNYENTRKNKGYL